MPASWRDSPFNWAATAAAAAVPSRYGRRIETAPCGSPPVSLVSFGAHRGTRLQALRVLRDLQVRGGRLLSLRDARRTRACPPAYLPAWPQPA